MQGLRIDGVGLDALAKRPAETVAAEATPNDCAPATVCRASTNAPASLICCSVGSRLKELIATMLSRNLK